MTKTKFIEFIDKCSEGIWYAEYDFWKEKFITTGNYLCHILDHDMCVVFKDVFDVDRLELELGSGRGIFGPVKELSNQELRFTALYMFMEYCLITGDYKNF